MSLFDATVELNPHQIEARSSHCSRPSERSRTPRGRLRLRRCDVREQHQIQEKLHKLERQQRRQRQEIFVGDKIMEKRDLLVDQLATRLARRTDTEALFTLRWAVE